MKSALQGHAHGGEHLEFTGPLWRWAGTANGTWHFVTLDGAVAEELTAIGVMRRLEGMGRGWGSLRVSVTIGETRWQTSVFPQKGDGGATHWLLPVKLAVREAEGLAEGDEVELTLDL